MSHGLLRLSVEAKLVHISAALGAGLRKVIRSRNPHARTEGTCEEAVRSGCANAIIIRPSLPVLGVWPW